jgi:hypothetical protein
LILVSLFLLLQLLLVLPPVGGDVPASGCFHPWSTGLDPGRGGSHPACSVLLSGW